MAARTRSNCPTPSVVAASKAIQDAPVAADATAAAARELERVFRSGAGDVTGNLFLRTRGEGVGFHSVALCESCLSRSRASPVLSDLILISLKRARHSQYLGQFRPKLTGAAGSRLTP